MARRGRAPWIAATTVLVLALAATVAVTRPWERGEPAAADTPAPVTAPVELATLTSQVRLNAQLGYGDAIPLPPATGMLTGLPAAGQVIQTGYQVYEADGRPVVLFRGTRPFWRELSTGVDGEDVRQLQQNLADLGFLDGVADGKFGDATKRAVTAWQKSLGLAQTGDFAPGDAVVADAPGIRIARVSARLGDAGASAATFTETTLRATAKLTTAQARELLPGTPVTVVLPDGTELDTVLASVDPGGVPTGEGDAVTPPTALVEFEDQTAVASVGSVAVRIIIRDDAEQPETLVVPVTALLATADGGYAVEVQDGEDSVRIPVEIGLVADARVQVLRSGGALDGDAGPELAEGDPVVLAR